jgi:hypothetical protein
MENKNYAKLVDGKIQYAPRKFIENGSLIVPREIDDEFYFSRGYFKVVDIKPHYDYATQNISILKWKVSKKNHTITSVYVVNENPIYSKQVRKFSKLKITLFCIENKIWQDVKEYLEKIGYYDLFVMAQYFLETDEYFVKGLEMFKEARVDAEITSEMLDEMIKNMLDFAFDGYEYIEIKNEATNN